MTGTVKFILPKRQRVAVLTEAKDFSIFQLITDGGVGMEDLLHWPEPLELGAVTVENKSRGTRVEVHFRQHQVAALAVGPALTRD